MRVSASAVDLPRDELLGYHGIRLDGDGEHARAAHLEFAVDPGSSSAGLPVLPNAIEGKIRVMRDHIENHHELARDVAWEARRCRSRFD